VDGWENVQLPDVARGNHFSYADARKLMYLALTYKSNLIVNYPDDAQLRMNMWATMFKSLGHVVHLLQDTASPQHVRSETHGYLCNGAWYEDASEAKVPTRTFENFTNYRVTAPFDIVLDPSGGKKTYSFANLCDDEKWRDMFRTGAQANPADTTPWTSGNTYPIPQFSVQRKFFTTRTEDVDFNARRGLADYVNRGFFTEGAFLANNGTPNPNLPSPPPLVNAAYTPGTYTTDFIPGLGGVENQTMYWQVPDVIAPNYPDRGLDNGKAPIVARSLWTILIRDPEGPPIELQNLGGNLTLRNYVQIADMTVPRAVAYTTGLINFFFRGKLEIEPIDQRIFAVMNTGEPHTVAADGYPIRTSNNKVFGFKKSALRFVTLLTPSSNPAPMPTLCKRWVWGIWSP